ncbi:MAG: CHAP domain-containing protein [Saprospiraceae bacterium]
MQYRNVREYRPEVNDILIYDAHEGNRFGHVAIISVSPKMR